MSGQSSDEAASQLATELDKIRHQTSSTLAHQRRPATLLAAIESTLTDEGAALTPVAYFAALSSTLLQLAESVTASATEDVDILETLQAVFYLLALVMPLTAASVLRSKIVTMINIMPNLLIAMHENAPAVKSLLTILQALMLSMDINSLHRLPIRQLYNTVLVFLIDSRPKVRRRAQEMVCAIMANPPAPSIKHPYASSTADFVLQSLSDAVQQGKKGGKRKAARPGHGQSAGAASEEASRAIGLCAFIRMVGKDWPTDSIGPLCTLLLSLPRVGNTFLTSASYDILEQLFSKSSASFESGKVEETLEAVLAARPANSGSVEDRILPGWLGTVEHGFVAFARSNPASCTKSLLSTFNGVMAYLTSSAPAVRQAATSTLVALIRYCISNDEIRYSVEYSPTDEIDDDHPLHALCESLLSSMRNVKYQGAGMSHLLQVNAALTSRLRSRCVPVNSKGKRNLPAAALLTREHVMLVGHLRSIEGYEHRDATEVVLATAVEVCGPAWVLELLPLNLTDEDKLSPEDPGRAWLLPLIRTKIVNTELSHFVDYFVPLSQRIYRLRQQALDRADATKVTEAQKTKAGVEAKIYEAIVAQIWALLPGYCDLPTDLEQAFTPGFCEILSNVMNSQEQLRPPVFRGLQLLVERNRAILASNSPPEVMLQSFGVDRAVAQRNLTLLGGLASDLLAVMFDIFSSANKEGRGYILDCIAAYLSVLPPADVTSTYGNLRTLLQQTLSTSAESTTADNLSQKNSALAILDFMIQLVPFISDAAIASSLQQLATSPEILNSKDSAIQKKAYRILVRMCECDNGVTTQAIQHSLETLVQQLVGKNSSISASAKKDRTVLLATIVPGLPNDQLHIIPLIIPEAVLATKEANEVARSSAYALLIAMGERMKQGGTVLRTKLSGMDKATDTAMEATGCASTTEYLTMVAAGLAGNSPHMISATITALSRLLFEYHSDLPQHVTQDLLTTILVFLSSKNREVVKSAVGFVKVAVVALPAADIQPHLAQLIPALLDWSTEHRNHFKLNIRHIFERLIRKFSFTQVESLAREDGRKLLANIRKRQQRAKRKKDHRAANGEPAGSDDEPKRPQAMRDAYEEALYGSEDEDADSGNDELQNTAPSKAGKIDKNNPGRAQQPQQLRKNAIGRKKGDSSAEQGDSAFIREDGDEPLDLLDERMLGRISRIDPSKAAGRRAKREEQGTDTNKGFKTDEKSGKIMFAEDSGDDDPAADGDKPVESTNAYLEAIRGEDGFRRDARGNVKLNKSTKRTRARLEEDELVENVKDRLADLGVAKPGQARAKKARKSGKEAIGQEFRAKRAGGDIKRNDGPTPYAYVPLGTGKKRSNVSIVNKGKMH